MGGMCSGSDSRVLPLDSSRCQLGLFPLWASVCPLQNRVVGLDNLSKILPALGSSGGMLVSSVNLFLFKRLQLNSKSAT